MIPVSMWRRIWKDTVGPQSGPVATITVLLSIAAVAGGLLGILVWKSVSVGLLRGAGNPLSVLALVYWALFMSGAAAQNKPANACLVPGLTRQVRQSAVLAWLLTMLPFAAVSYAHPQGWAVLLSASVGVTAFGMYRAGCGKFAAVASAAAIVYLYPGMLQHLGGAELGAACVASLLFMAWGLRHAFPQGGERHFAMLDKHARVQAMDGMDSSSELARRGDKRRPVYDIVLRHDLAARKARHLLMHALGPSAHRLYVLLPLTCVALGIVVASESARMMGFSPDMEKVARLFFGSFFAMLPFSWYRFASAIRSAGPEQSLARLAPGLPRAERLNRELGIHIMKICLLEWLVVTAVALGFLALWDAPRTSFMVTPAFLVAMLPLLSLGLGDFSGKSTYGIAAAAVASVVCCVIALSTVFLREENVQVWLVLMASMLALSGVCILSKWRQMMAAPPSFPAGRAA